MTAPGNILKQCSTCGIDVVGRKRWKDNAGRYYCGPCWTRKIQEHRQQAESSTNRGEDSEPLELPDLEQLPLATDTVQESTQNMLACAGCGMEIGRNDTHEHGGKPYCFQCVIQFATDESKPTQAVALASKPPNFNSPSSYDVVTTRQCPYCDEEIQASARKCKHCGEWLDRHSTTPVMSYRNPISAQRSAGSITSARSYLNSAVLTLILYVIGFGIVGLIANVVYLSSARRVERETGTSPEGKGCLVALMWVFVWIPLIIGAVVVMLIMVADMKH